jgi:hypothetical protein
VECLAGVSLAIPVGAAFTGFGIAGLKSMKKDADVSAAFNGDGTS